jgi:hypothetical protein
MALSVARKQRALANLAAGGGEQTCAQFAARIDKLVRGLEGPMPRAAVEKGALEAKKALLKTLTRAVPSRRLRNVGGARLNVRYDVKGERNPTALVQAIGPWQIVEEDIKPHTILPHSVGRAKGRSKVARRQAKQDLYNALFGGVGGFAGQRPLKTPYGPRFRVNHPGTRGKHPWRDGVAAAQRSVPKVMAAQVVADVESVLRG